MLCNIISCSRPYNIIISCASYIIFISCAVPYNIIIRCAIPCDMISCSMIYNIIFICGNNRHQCFHYLHVCSATLGLRNYVFNIIIFVRFFRRLLDEIKFIKTPCLGHRIGPHFQAPSSFTSIDSHNSPKRNKITEDFLFLGREINKSRCTVNHTSKL